MAVQDLRLALRDPGTVFWLFVAPVLWVFFFSFLNQGSDPTQTRISLGVVREDGSDAAARLVDQIRSENFDVVVVAGAGDLPSGKKAPARGLTIPAGFGDAIGKRQKIDLVLREGEQANPEGTIASQIALHRAIVRLLAGLSFGDPGPEGDLVTVRSSWAGRRAIPSGYSQTVPGNLVMFVILISMTFGSGLLARERKTRILARLGTSPLTRTEIFLGKVAARFLMAAIQVTLFVLLGLTVCRMDWGDSPLGLVLLLSSFVACASTMGILGGTLFRSPDASSGVGVAAALVMSALGGCWWPSEVMPPWLQRAGHAFPTAWAMDGLHQITSWGGGAASVLLPSLVLALFAIGAGSIAVRRLSFD